MPGYDPTDPYGQYEDESAPQTGEAPQWVKDLRKENKDMAKQLSQAQRENAFLKVDGLKTADPVFELFSAQYDGELTAEAIKEAAGKYGLVQTAESTQAPNAGDAPATQEGGEGRPAQPHPDAAATGRIDAAADGASTPPATDEAWKHASTPEAMLAQYQAAGGKVATGE